MARSVASGAPAQGGLFVRKATGLVREVGSGDAIILNLFNINIPLGVLLITQAPYIWPGINMVLAMGLAVVILIPPYLMYAFLGAAMPRAGGDYVFVSRIIHPAVGFVANLAWALTSFVFVAVFAAWVSSVGLSPALATLGTVLQNSQLISLSSTLTTHNWEFGIGVVALLLNGTLSLFGWRAILPTMRVIMVIVLAALVVVVVLMITTDNSGFQRAFSQYASYSDVIAKAKASGFQVGATSNIAKILGFFALAYSFDQAMLPVFAGGEVKSPARNMLVAILGGLIIAGLIVMLFAGLAYRTFGPDFLGGMTFLSTNAPSSYPALPPPFFFLYASMLTHNVPLLLLVNIGFVLAIIAGMVTLWLQLSRFFLAYSLDRILPDWLSEVHPKFHSPVRINILVAVAAIALLAFYVYGPTNFFGILYSVALLQAITMSVTALAGILFAWRAPALFASSPYSQKLAGIPVIAVLGVVSLVELVYFASVFLTNSAIGANAPTGLVAVVVFLLIGIPIYAISYFVQRGHGVNIALAFRELPPE